MSLTGEASWASNSEVQLPARSKRANGEKLLEPRESYVPTEALALGGGTWPQPRKAQQEGDQGLIIPPNSSALSFPAVCPTS